jgi:hypothetical protein
VSHNFDSINFYALKIKCKKFLIKIFFILFTNYAQNISFQSHFFQRLEIQFTEENRFISRGEKKFQVYKYSVFLKLFLKINDKINPKVHDYSVNYSFHLKQGFKRKKEIKTKDRENLIYFLKDYLKSIMKCIFLLINVFLFEGFFSSL